MTEEEDKCIFCEKITVGVRLSPDTFVCHECYGKLGKVEKKLKHKKVMKKELCVDKVLKFLKENPKFFKVKKIAESIGHSPLTVKKSLTALRKEEKVGLYLNRWWGWKGQNKMTGQDLLNSGICGVLKDRKDMNDSVGYAKTLGDEALS